MIDLDGFRLNVGIIIANSEKKLFWGKRLNRRSWQFPQGGIEHGEDTQDAMFRELNEEAGLSKQNVKILAQSTNWLTYKLPSHLIRKDQYPLCIGQKQKWFLLLLLSPDSSVNLSKMNNPEFDDWRWVNYWYPVNNVVAFKKQVYIDVLNEFKPKVDLITNLNC